MINPYALLAVLVAFVLNGFYWHHQGAEAENTKWTARIESERAASTLAARVREHQMQGAFDASAKKQAAQLAATRRNLAVALDGLRDRPERAAGVSEAPRADCAGGSGAELSRSDADFLVRETSRADDIRSGLVACYAAIDAITP